MRQRIAEASWGLQQKGPTKATRTPVVQSFSVRETNPAHRGLTLAGVKPKQPCPKGDMELSSQAKLCDEIGESKFAASKASEGSSSQTELRRRRVEPAKAKSRTNGKLPGWPALKAEKEKLRCAIDRRNIAESRRQPSSSSADRPDFVKLRTNKARPGCKGSRTGIGKPRRTAPKAENDISRQPSDLNGEERAGRKMVQD